MIRLVLVSAVLLLVSTLSLVTVRYQSRALFAQSERLKSQAHELDTEWRRLQLERASLARNARIDSLARANLHLVPVRPDRTIYLRTAPSSASTSVPAGPGATP